MLPLNEYSSAMSTAFGFDECEVQVQCWVIGPQHSPALASYSQSIVNTLMENPTFIQAWVHTYDFDQDGYAEPALYAAGRKNGGDSRLVISPISSQILNSLSKSLSSNQCEPKVECTVVTKDTLPPHLAELFSDVTTGEYTPPSRLWVDKALSRNPVLYINRPEFLRYYAYQSGLIRVMTSPKSFSDITLDLKLTFNLIITLFSTSWLSLGVFLILFHTRRQLMA